MITNGMVGYGAKSIVDPVSGGNYYGGIGSGGVSGGNGSGGGGGGGNNCFQMTSFELASLKQIEQLYTSNLSNRTYHNIPTDYVQYLKLFNIVHAAYTKYKSNAAISLLFQITTEALTGSINAYGLNTLNLDLEVQNTYLQGVLEEIINGVNITKAFDQNVGTLSMTQTFELAPLFVYYIKLYGVPSPGVGFDPVKLSLVLTALENSGIDPYK
jgi:hypothetical protein